MLVFSGAPGTVQDIIEIEAKRPRDAAHPKLARLQSEIEAQLERVTAETELTQAERLRMLGHHSYG